MPKGWDFSSDSGDRWMVHSQDHVAQISRTVFKVGEQNSSRRRNFYGSLRAGQKFLEWVTAVRL